MTVFDQHNLSRHDLNICEIVKSGQGKWYACITVKDRPKHTCGTNSIGLDLGCKLRLMATHHQLSLPTNTLKNSHKSKEQTKRNWSKAFMLKSKTHG